MYNQAEIKLKKKEGYSITYIGAVVTRTPSLP